MTTTHRTRETIHFFGEHGRLFGVLTEAGDAHRLQDNDLCLVFLNAGLLHRVGPYRMFVDLAREVASSGLPAFRFDLGGLGDSQMGAGAEPEEKRVVSEIREALDYLEQKRGFRRFITVGLCSGADHAHALGLVDPRLVGAVMMDGPGYPNLQFQMHHYAPKVTRLKSWQTAAQRLLNPEERTPKLEIEKEETFVREFAPQEQMEKEIKSLADRGIELLYLYTGGVQYYFNHESQFAENFPSLRFNQPGCRIQYQYYGGSDHTYSDPRDRQQMKARVVGWLQDLRNKL